MARIEGAEFPIRFEQAKGPAVDSWNSRKEENNNARYTSDKLRESFEESRDDVLGDIDVLLAGVSEKELLIGLNTTFGAVVRPPVFPVS